MNSNQQAKLESVKQEISAIEHQCVAAAFELDIEKVTAMHARMEALKFIVETWATRPAPVSYCYESKPVVTFSAVGDRIDWLKKEIAKIGDLLYPGGVLESQLSQWQSKVKPGITNQHAENMLKAAKESYEHHQGLLAQYKEELEKLLAA